MKKTILIRITAALLGLLSAIGLCACSKPGISVGTGDPSGSVSGEQSPSLLPSDPSAVLPSLPSDGTDGNSSKQPVNPSPSKEPTPSEEPTPTPTPSEEPTPTPTPSDDPVDPPEPVKTVEVPASSVRHVFTHCLINDPKKGCATASGPLDVDCLTVSEFEKLLQSLYDNDFVLIDINDMYVLHKNGTAKLAPTVTVPEGKKPLVFSIDDVTYDPRKKGSGMIDRLVIENGTIMGCYDHADGSTTLTDGEVFPILEKFLKTHPDFSYNGAKFTLALTGFAGILGYRTDEQYAEQGIDVAKEREKAMVVVNWLKANGYNFACHSYSHNNYTTCSLDRVQRDVMMWNRNVKPLIGETKVFIYPYGAWTNHGTEKHNLLLKEGFVMFCGTSQLNTIWDGKQPKEGGVASGTGTIYLERFTITGFTVRTYANAATYMDYYYNYYKSLGNDEATAKQKAQKNFDSLFEVSYNNMQEYCDPMQIYDHENRYHKILADEE